MRPHHRKIRYRPPRDTSGEKSGSGDLYLRFVKNYLGPWKWQLLLCAVLVSLNGCSVYLVAYYGCYVVDHILMIHVVPDQASTEKAPEFRGRIDRRPAAAVRPHAGRLRRMDQADSPVALPPAGAGRQLLFMFILYMATIILLNTSARLANHKRILIGQSACARLRDDLHKKILQLSISSQKTRMPGRLLARITADVDAVQNQLMITVLNAAASLATIILGAVILFAAEWRLALLAFLAAPLYALVWRQSRDPLRRLAIEMRYTNACLYNLATQKFDSIKAIQSYGREAHECLDFHRLGGCFLRDAMAQQRLAVGVSQLSVVIATLGTGGVFILGTFLVDHGAMTLGKMMYVYGSAASLFAPVLILAQVSVVFNRLLVILRRLAEILDAPVEIEEAADALPFPKPLKTGIRVRNLQYAHAPDAEPVIQNLSLDIPAGKWTCIMGPSGCGKTTLLYLLARLCEPQQGEILLDGRPLRNYALAELRQFLALVPQEAQIFRGTVRDNICYAHPDASPSRIMAAARAAELHDLIMEMPIQYETLVGEKGVSLSGGQRQRLSLARALITQPDVLLLDDCTSALDANTERRIQETLSRILTGRTAVMISQRVSMAMRCDRIYIMENGKISEAGTHDELLALDGFYARLCHRQTGD